MKRCGKRNSISSASCLRRGEIRCQHGGAHFLIVLDCHRGNRVGVWATRAFELRACGIRICVAGQQIGELCTVLKSAVQALSVKRHDSVGRIANEQQAPHVPWPAVEGREFPLRMLDKLMVEIGDERQRVWKLCRKKCTRQRRRSQGIEPRRTMGRKKQRGGERAVGIGEGNEHIVTARPDVQRVKLECRPASIRGRNVQFLVVMSQNLFRRLHQSAIVKCIAQRRSGSISTDDQGSGSLVLRSVDFATPLHRSRLRLNVQSSLFKAHFYRRQRSLRPRSTRH